jgi:hypothetical protein
MPSGDALMSLGSGDHVLFSKTEPQNVVFIESSVQWVYNALRH